jgi:hypothetical protein
MSIARAQLFLDRYCARRRSIQPFWLHARTYAVWVPLLLLSVARVASGESSAGAAAEVKRLQKLVDAMRAHLELTHEVRIDLVERNPLLASVEPVKGSEEAFRLSLEQAFFERLTEDELRAVLAHELGHVWIFTHFPYLQTEQLANQIALRLVTRESLEQVYGKVWPHAVDAGSLPRFAEARPPARPAEATGNPR